MSSSTTDKPRVASAAADAAPAIPLPTTTTPPLDRSAFELALHHGVDPHVIASAIGHSKASITRLDQQVNDALPHAGFAHLAALAPRHEPDGDGPLAEVVDLSARRRRGCAPTDEYCEPTKE